MIFLRFTQPKVKVPRGWGLFSVVHFLNVLGFDTDLRGC